MLDGIVDVTAGKESVQLHANDFAFFPAGQDHAITSANGAGLVVFEREYTIKVGWQYGRSLLALRPAVWDLPHADGSSSQHDACSHVPCPWAGVQGGATRFLHGNTEAQPLLPMAGEVFQLRKLLPQTGDYDFNIHIMDFLPGMLGGEAEGDPGHVGVQMPQCVGATGDNVGAQRPAEHLF